MTDAEIRQWRERRGWTLDQMAEALGVDRMAVWRWEQPPDSPHRRTPAPYLHLALRWLARRK